MGSFVKEILKLFARLTEDDVEYVHTVISAPCSVHDGGAVDAAPTLSRSRAKCR